MSKAIECIQCNEMKDEWTDAVKGGVCKSCRLKNLHEERFGLQDNGENNG